MRAFRFGEWCFMPSSGELSGRGRKRRLEPRVSEVLTVLLAHPNEVLSRMRLFELVWRDRIVVDEALTRAISQLRLALDDVEAPHRYVETLPKRGYRWVAGVRIETSLSGCFVDVSPHVAHLLAEQGAT
jgi:DNA-binding winged helix-turn-helix (wHTH) protein